MSLFRLAIVLSCGVALMPSDKEQQQQLYERAANAAYWTATFCDRNEKTCETAGMLWETFVAKAQFAGKLGYDIAQRYAASGQTQPVKFEEPAASAGAKAKVEKISATEADDKAHEPQAQTPAADEAKTGTLRPDDLAPEWRGKQQGGA